MIMKSSGKQDISLIITEKMPQDVAYKRGYDCKELIELATPKHWFHEYTIMNDVLHMRKDGQYAS
ncbi:hypothetical protein LTR66_015345, partial [Elasticomyces elasticus]